MSTNYPQILKEAHKSNQNLSLQEITTKINTILHFHSDCQVRFIEKLIHENLKGDYSINIESLVDIIVIYTRESPYEKINIVKHIAEEFYNKMYKKDEQQKQETVVLYELLLERIKRIEGITITKGGRKALKALLKTFLYNTEINPPQLVGTVNSYLLEDMFKYGDPIAMNISTNDCTVFVNQHFECSSVYWYYNLLDKNISVGSLVKVEGSPFPRLVVSTDKSIAYSDIRKKVESIEDKSYVDYFRNTILIDDKKAYAIQSIMAYNKLNGNNKISSEMLLKIIG